MTNLILRLIINAVALLVAAFLVNGINVTQDIGSLALVAIIFGVTNALIAPIVKFFTCPVYVLTLGLFALLVNALLLMLVGAISDQLVGAGALEVAGFLPALLGSVVISIVSTVLSLFLKDKD